MVKVTRVSFAQHAHIALNARGQYRRAAAHCLHQHMRAAFHAAGVHQHMRALNLAAGAAVRQCTQPAVVGVSVGTGLGLCAQLSIKRLADVVDQHIRVLVQQGSSGKQGLG